MSAEFKVIRKKRDALDTSVPEGDHRKRRRNRTTQSCLNCHTSKRMCDRKRPCGRCTQLGLTGLCVYEVDDPSQRSDSQDESSRLRKRVAELEGVIRELKNKPHPRWAQGVSTAQPLPIQTESLQTESCQSSVTTEQEKPKSVRESSSRECSIQKDSFVVPHVAGLDISTLNFGLPSPPGTTSSVIGTPTDDYSQSHATINEDHRLPRDFDLDSIFATYAGLASHDGILGLNGDCEPSISKPNDTKQVMSGHCGCLDEATNYTAVLELSLWLRKAADTLSRWSNHRMGMGGCSLDQKIIDLDYFAIATLTSATTTSNGPAQPSSRGRAPNSLVRGTVPSFSINGCLPRAPSSTVSPQSLHVLRSWDVASLPDSYSAGDDSFMSWESSRRS
ncbi:hypothetical protein EDC04DRAFT_2612893 [Pisolithus marmoratus]|nr:hypothetical protein EDC04DRAFT_2612893 [Pisolithus marmoratus]